MYVSPASGGGVTLHNNLEPPPPGFEVHHARPWIRPLHVAPFPGTLQHTFVDRGLGSLPNVLAARVPMLPGAVAAFNAQFIWRSVALQWLALSKALKADALLFSPQSEGDLHATNWVLAHTDLASLVWFMDDYFEGGDVRSLMGDVMNKADGVLAISDQMADAFKREFGVKAQVFNNVVEFQPWVPAAQNPVLRVGYAGAIHAFYREAFELLAAAVAQTHSAELHVFTDHPLPNEFQSNPRIIQRGQLSGQAFLDALRDMDVLALLSSFAPSHRRLAERSLASKLADYQNAGRPIVAIGPLYSANAAYVAEQQAGILVDVPKVARVLEVLGRLESAELRHLMGSQSHQRGRASRDAMVARRRMWGLMGGLLRQKGARR